MKKLNVSYVVAAALLTGMLYAPAFVSAGFNVIPIKTGPSTGNAVVADVLATKTFSNATAVDLVGTMPNNGAVTLYPQMQEQTIAAGYHDGTGTVAAIGSYPMGERFVDNPVDPAADPVVSNGTVTDNATGLIWLKNANCTTLNATLPTAGDAAAAVAALVDGVCDLADGSAVDTWRLPTIEELASLVDYSYTGPALSNAAGAEIWAAGDAFVDVLSANYWSSTDVAAASVVNQWAMSLDTGSLVSLVKADGTANVWAVKVTPVVTP